MSNALVSYLLSLADNNLILGHRTSEWCGHGPILEQDIAITNMALDCIGQARNFYQYAAEIIGDNTTEDSLAYLRDTTDFTNCLLVELPNGDWAQTVLRHFLFSTYQYYLYQQLQNTSNPQLAAITEKGLKEMAYHVRWSSEWVIRLGDGTEESKDRILQALDTVWGYTGELFQPADFDLKAQQEGWGADLLLVKRNWDEKIKAVFEEATIPMPATTWMHAGGKQGKHTEHLGFILAEMQFLQRAYPNSEW